MQLRVLNYHVVILFCLVLLDEFPLLFCLNSILGFGHRVVLDYKLALREKSVFLGHIYLAAEPGGRLCSVSIPLGLVAAEILLLLSLSVIHEYGVE